ncbi:hypothetical protein RFI_27852 [Reticulomyxa filosa]|uniref:DH domain-containing protein n=1 Tax=Reticulomyxa filosa TaxID=46433 RepID=X6M7A5_RETFI|nr:hypothetical protein RFI_27852 [Reticulomyxa filosa]|eukprot:ETO09526.1 hypothetical protein RFI_27852 [Reticulomyxa filosa]
MAAPSTTLEHEAENGIFYAVQELAQTERGYLKSLNQLRRVLEQSKKQKRGEDEKHKHNETKHWDRNTSIKMLESKVLNEEKIHAYFLEILIINGIHYLLSENLERELDCWPSSQIPQLFLQFVQLLFTYFFCLFYNGIETILNECTYKKLCTSLFFLSNYHNSQKKKKKNEKKSTFYFKKKKKKKGKSYWPQKIENLLITPVQRIPRYKLLLAVLKNRHIFFFFFFFVEKKKEIIKLKSKIPKSKVEPSTPVENVATKNDNTQTANALNDSAREIEEQKSADTNTTVKENRRHKSKQLSANSDTWRHMHSNSLVITLTEEKPSNGMGSEAVTVASPSEAELEEDSNFEETASIKDKKERANSRDSIRSKHNLTLTISTNVNEEKTTTDITPVLSEPKTMSSQHENAILVTNSKVILFTHFFITKMYQYK